MDLTFTSNGGMFIAEFVATADFNLHLETVSSGSIIVEQKSVENGQYVTAYSRPQTWKHFDTDFAGVVWPKYIRISTSAEPTLAVVTFSE